MMHATIALAVFAVAFRAMLLRRRFFFCDNEEDVVEEDKVGSIDIFSLCFLRAT